MNNFAPIAMFVFKRPEHTRRVLESLARNSEFLQSPLYIFCDGSRHPRETEAVISTRKVIDDIEHPYKVVIKRNENFGLAKSIQNGISQILESYEKIIVIEDDLIIAPYFLKYMNTALVKYATNENVKQISGHMFPIDFGNENSTIMLPFTTSWGWGTWSRAWIQHLEPSDDLITLLNNYKWRYRFDQNGSFPFSKMLLDRFLHKNDSWAILWYYNIFKQDGIVLFPTKTLIQNVGFDGSGIHCSNNSPYNDQLNVNEIINFCDPKLFSHDLTLVRQFLFNNRGKFKNIFDWLQRIILNTNKLK